MITRTPRRDEYQRLLAVGVNRRCAAVLAGYRALPRTGEQLAAHRRGNQRTTRCPECSQPVQVGNLARHRRSAAHRYARRAA